MSRKKKRADSPFGGKLKQLRKQRKITMKRLADQLGVSESYISRLESGERHPDRELILKMEPILFPEGDPVELDALLIAADYTPVQLDTMTGSNDVIHHFRQVLEQDPENFRAFNALVLSLIKQDKLEAAEAKIQEGLQRFDDSVHLQVLMGALEVVRGNFEKALQYQREALDNFNQSEQGSSFVTQVDMLLNLAVILFLKGYAAIDDYLNASTEKHYALARNNLEQASDSLEEALKIAPEDVYVLDEYARVQFNLAYLEECAGKRPDYARAISAFEQVIHSDEKARLNYTELVESTLFLVHAYAKTHQFDAAEQHAHLIECCLPNFWLVHYIKACLYALKYRAENKTSCLDKGFRSLERAMRVPGKDNRTLSEATFDPDLAPLRHADAVRFDQILKLEASS